MTGIQQAPEYPPEAANDTPMVITYHVRCTFDYSLTYSRSLHTIHCDVLLARSMLENDEQQARPYILRGLTAIAGSVQLSNTATHCLLLEAIGPGVLPYGGIDYYGVRFILEVKIKHESLTVAA